MQNKRESYKTKQLKVTFRYLRSFSSSLGAWVVPANTMPKERQICLNSRASMENIIKFRVRWSHHGPKTFFEMKCARICNNQIFIEPSSRSHDALQLCVSFQNSRKIFSWDIIFMFINCSLFSSMGCGLFTPFQGAANSWGPS